MSRRIFFRFLIVLVFLLVIGGVGGFLWVLEYFGPDTRCAILHKDEAFTNLGALPKTVAQDFLSVRLRNNPIADRWDDFQQTDTVPDGRELPFYRFIYGGRVKDYVYIWYEIGGEGPSSLIALYELPKNQSGAPKLVNHILSYPESMCPDTYVLVHGPNIRKAIDF